jgi:GAF domain-containing protein
VLSEPIPGVVGSAVAARILATGISPMAVLMVPVLAGGQLLVMLELGIESKAGFTATDAAVAEQIAKDLGAIARKREWHRD